MSFLKEHKKRLERITADPHWTSKPEKIAEMQEWNADLMEYNRDETLLQAIFTRRFWRR